MGGALGRRVLQKNISLKSSFSWPKRLLLTGVILLSGRLFYGIASHSVARGSDDCRYAAKKKSPDFDWKIELFKTFLSVALI